MRSRHCRPDAHRQPRRPVRGGLAHTLSWALRILCLLVPVGAHAQAPTLLSALGFEPVVWERWEVRAADRQALLTRSGIPLDSFPSRDAFHVVDVDADGLADLVYSGECLRMQPPCEGTVTRVYRNTGAGFVLAFEARPYHVAALVRNEWRGAPDFVLTEDDAGDCSTIAGLMVLRPTSPPDTALFRVVNRLRYFPGMRWPGVRLPAPVSVRVLQDRYNLRFAPSADDSTAGDFPCAEDYRGNVVATFGSGATAVALAQLRNGTRLWYFVMTDSASTFTTAFPGLGGASGRLLGWMSSRFLLPIPTR